MRIIYAALVGLCSSCTPAPDLSGQAGGPCYGNDTCNAGLACDDGRCVYAALSDAGGLVDAGETRADDAGVSEQDGGGNVPACDAPENIVPGDFTIVAAADVDLLEPFTLIEGSLVVDGTSIVELALPNLREVGGSLDAINNDVLIAVRAPCLRSVGVDLSLGARYSETVSENQIGELDLPSLAEVGDDLVVAGTGLTTLTLPALSSVGFLSIVWNPLLDSVSAPDLELATFVRYEGNAVLTDLSLVESVDGLGSARVYDMPALVDVIITRLPERGVDFAGCTALQRVIADGAETGGLRVRESSYVTSVSAPDLASGSVGVAALPLLTSLNVDSLQIGTLSLEDVALSKLTAPNLVEAESIILRNNDALAGLDLPLLVELGVIDASDNPLLPACIIDALAEVAGGSVQQNAGNREGCDCSVDAGVVDVFCQ